ncbi:trinucleotide repeat-containing protein [Pontoporia blainvillei]|uniref:Trinucleotide repeat-containing protein n=1 Tax=Pontoporia blainvillei TaxID=48723 RepID=A0ABX0S398_PONBL|nr:trinucleotide repeat-containing protein [Pontoporia blainvillei]
MDNLPGAASPLDQNPSKHGAIPGGLSIGPPAKSSIDDSYGRYDLIQSSESPASPPGSAPHSWSRAKSDSDKIANGSSINWPPEFHPGVPWKGLQNIDPENDPDVTPGSVPTGPTINTTIQDVNRYLLKSGASTLWPSNLPSQKSSDPFRFNPQVTTASSSLFPGFLLSSENGVLPTVISECHTAFLECLAARCLRLQSLSQQPCARS